MTLMSPAQAEEQLRHVTQQFAQRRQSRTTPRGRIPEALWAQAVTPRPGVALGEGRQATRLDSACAQTAPGRSGHGSPADSPVALLTFCRSHHGLTRPDSGGRGPTARWYPSADHL
jgi:hypothetical protein